MGRRVDDYKTFEEGITTVTFIVEEEKLYASKELLALASPFFKAMFSKEFKEEKSCEVPLPGKSFKAVVWLLDYLYPESELTISDEIAFALLPLAHEYLLPKLEDKCVSKLMKQENPRLEVTTLAKVFKNEHLHEAAMAACVKSVNSAELEKQMALPENRELEPKENKELELRVFVQILRLKLEALKAMNCASCGRSAQISQESC